MSIQRQVFNKIIKVVRILLIVLTILAILFSALLCICFRNDNKSKSKNFSEKDYKIISSVFGIDEGTFEIKDVIYCPYIDDENRWYNENGYSELYTVRLFMNDISALEKNYNLTKKPDGCYSMDICRNKLNSNIAFKIDIYLGDDLDNPDNYRVRFSYSGHNDKLHDILPFITFKLKVFVVLFTFLFVLIWTCFRDGRKSKSKNVSE